MWDSTADKQSGLITRRTFREVLSLVIEYNNARIFIPCSYISLFSDEIHFSVNYFISKLFNIYSKN